jgi:hypothetical protein
MSQEQVLRAERENVFLPRTRWLELASDHVAIDQLEGSGAWEERANRSILQDHPVSVVGPVGVGKSSLIAFVCANLPESHVAFRLPVTGADDPTSVSDMASLALGMALHAIDLEAYQRDAIERARAESTVVERHSSGLPGGKLGGGAVPAEVNVQLGSLREEHLTRKLAGDRLAGLDRLIDILTYHGRQPVFICEDTEAMVGGAVREDVVERFFNGPIRAFLTEVGAPLVVAVQTDIARSSATFQDLRTRTTEIEVTGFSDPHDALRRIADKRLSDCGLGCAASDVLHTDAVDALVGFYGETGFSLRYSLAVLNSSTGHAADMAADLVRAAHVQRAAAEWRAQRR